MPSVRGIITYRCGTEKVVLSVGFDLHRSWCKATCRAVPRLVPPTPGAGQKLSCTGITHACPRSAEAVFKFDSEWTLVHTAEAQMATSLEAGLGQRCSGAHSTALPGDCTTSGLAG